MGTGESQALGWYKLAESSIWAQAGSANGKCGLNERFQDVLVCAWRMRFVLRTAGNYLDVRDGSFLLRSTVDLVDFVFMEDTRAWAWHSSFFQLLSYSIFIFPTFPLNRQIEMLVFSCSGMRSHFLHMTFKMPALSNTQVPFLDQGWYVSCKSPPRNKGGGGWIWLLHLKQIKASFFPVLFTCLGCLPQNNCQHSTLCYGRKVSWWSFYALQSFLSL